MTESTTTTARATELEKLWEKHIALEFSTKNADLTVETMIDNPYVNHIPTMTGGSGKTDLRDFYRDHFISKLPDDTKSIMVSRTISDTRLVEEMVFCFTHDREVDFLLPGVAPTGKYVEVPLVAIVTFEGNKISSEHIYWDQASVLAQIGLLDSRNLPVCGIESAKKLLDKSVPFRKL